MCVWVGVWGGRGVCGCVRGCGDGCVRGCGGVSVVCWLCSWGCRYAWSGVVMWCMCSVLGGSVFGGCGEGGVGLFFWWCVVLFVCLCFVDVFCY